MTRIARSRCLSLAASLLLATTFIPTAAAAPFSDLIVFGDSLSDIGNISQATFGTVPGKYYWNGRFSNGPTYADSLAVGLGLSPLGGSRDGGNDFAYGRAKTSGTGLPYSLVVRDIDDQVSDYLGSRTVSATALYLIFAGANDLLQGQADVNVPVNNISQDLSQLYADGARKFLVLNLPPLGYTPHYNTSPTDLAKANAITQQFNAALSTMLDGFQSSNPAASVFRFDVAALISQALADPEAFGLVNVTNSAAPGLSYGATSYDTSQIVPNPNQYLFWDDVHPTAAVHAILGQRVVQMFFEPGDFNHDSKVDAADYLVWRKGLGAGFIQSDYNAWRANFGHIQGSGSGSVRAASDQVAIPEPATLALALLACWSAAGRSFRSHVARHN
ncbi:MAG TPA: SGNH/GDSL hydrolase family protein [Lacipirellulaceae bacterium]|nr:SGNH/GDSL hydrolase family protein [Lacipirellulaceae bacterium]